MNPQLANTLIGLGVAFVLTMLVLLVYVINMIKVDNKRYEFERISLDEYIPFEAEAERQEERRMMAAMIAAGIASNIGAGFHSTQIAADALRIADEIIKQSEQPPEQYVVSMVQHKHGSDVSTATFEARPMRDAEPPSNHTRA